MDKTNKLPVQSCRLNYIPLTVGEGNSTRNNEEAKDKQRHIENLLFLSQLKKQKKKKLCNSSSIENINGINLIDSHSLKQNKLKERIGPKLILPNIVKEFYKKIIANDTVNGTVEILEFNDWFDPSYEFIDYFDIKKASRKYIENEKNWYMSLDKSIIGHPGIESNKIWQYCASKDEKQEES